MKTKTLFIIGIVGLGISVFAPPIIKKTSTLSADQTKNLKDYQDMGILIFGTITVITGAIKIGIKK